MRAAVAEFLAIFDQERGAGGWVGRAPDSFGPVVFGGIGLALTIRAACRDAPEGARLHSIHGHFLRPMQGGAEVTFRTDVVKRGRSFNLHRVAAEQDGRACLELTCSFTADGDGPDYDATGIPDDVRHPDELDVEVPPGEEPGTFDVRWLGPSASRPDGTRESTHRHWFRIAEALAEDVHLHTAILGYATDWTGVGGRPLDLEGDTTGMISLDHAAWFHRPPRVDEWLLQDVHCLVNAGGRSTLRGTIKDTHGRVVASMAQEMLLRS